MIDSSPIRTYPFFARVLPCIVVALPAGLAIVSWFPETKLLPGFASATVGTAVSFLLAQLGRDQGRKKQDSLFRAWGGKPSTQLLRHRDPRIDPMTKARHHKKLSALSVDLSIPTPEEEAGDPGAADAVYDSAVKLLLELTRGDKLLYSENVSYGFRRNLWGMRPAGILLALLGLAASFTALVWRWPSGGLLLPCIAMAGNGLLLTWWSLRINRAWVKPQAFAFAERLLACCEVLPDELPVLPGRDVKRVSAPGPESTRAL